MIINKNKWSLDIKDDLVKKLEEDYKTKDIAPTKENIFKVFELVSFEDVSVVILGQDPYPKKGDANGIAFSVNRDEKLPASLKNMYKELEADLNIKRETGDLSEIVKQGVLLMNTVLTVEVTKANSHNKYNWQYTTDKVIKDLSSKGNVVFVLLGGSAQKKIPLIDDTKNIIIKEVHPSPLSAYRGFLGSKIYTQINEALINLNKKTIDWSK